MNEEEAEKLGKASSEVHHCFGEYQRARMEFVDAICNLADQKKNIETLVNGGVIEILKQLLNDQVLCVQNMSALSLGKIASYDAQVACEVIEGELLGQIVFNMERQNKSFQNCACYLLRSVAKHSVKLASLVVKAGAIPVFFKMCENYDPKMKESGLWGLYFISSHSAELASQVVEGSHEVECIIRCAKEPHISLKRISVCLMTNIVKHSLAHSQAFINKNVLDVISELITDFDTLLRRQIFSFLAQTLKHDKDMAENIIEKCAIFPYITKLINSSDFYERKNSTTCLLSIAKHNEKLSSLIVRYEGLEGLMENIREKNGSAQWPALKTLGYIASHSDDLKKNVIEDIGIVDELITIVEDPFVEDFIKSAAVWTIGMISGKNYPLMKKILEADSIIVLYNVYVSPKSSSILKGDTLKTIRKVIMLCQEQEYLSPLLDDKTEVDILKIVVRQLALLLPASANERRLFAKTKGFVFLQTIKGRKKTDPKVMEDIRRINVTFPKDIVNFKTPNYEKKLLKLIEKS